jgi:hypothetical protein
VLTAVIMALGPLGVQGCGGDGSASRAVEVAPGSSGECGCGTGAKFSVHQPLDCFCGDRANAALCPGTSADFASGRICRQGGIVIRASGCGKVSLSATGFYAGTSPTFDAQTDRLVGVYEFSDVVFDSCAAFAYIYGAALFPADGIAAQPQDACPTIAYCTVCGPSSDAFPACP